MEIKGGVKMQVALTVAGSDSGGGAGIQADLKTFQELGVFGTSVITSLTAQNTLGVQGVLPIEPSFIELQFQSVVSDLKPSAMKTGMLYSPEIVSLISRLIIDTKICYVCDPVMVAKGGQRLLMEDSIEAVKRTLMPVVSLATPNIPEAEILAGMSIVSVDDMVLAGKKIQALGAKNVLVKGGHLNKKGAPDVLISEEGIFQYSTETIETKNTHGTGCTYSAAITAELAKGTELFEAVKIGKAFVHQAILHDIHLGGGHGPTNHHGFVLNNRDTDFVEVHRIV